VETAKLEDMVRGWFVGDFEPTCLKTQSCEVACRRYRKDDFEARHLHKAATEISVVVEGSVEMNGVIYKEGDIIVMHPGEATDFRALEDAVNVVVKIPSARNDKYLTDE
jgi:hypothetical protein